MVRKRSVAISQRKVRSAQSLTAASAQVAATSAQIVRLPPVRNAGRARRVVEEADRSACRRGTWTLLAPEHEALLVERRHQIRSGYVGLSPGDDTGGRREHHPYERWFSIRVSKAAWVPLSAPRQGAAPAWTGWP